MSNQKSQLLNLTRAELRAWFVEQGEAPFRADQLLQWIFQQGETRWDRMSNLGRSLQAALAARGALQLPTIHTEQISSDGTIKWLLSVAGAQIETVYIPETSRGTLCVSSQVGCPLACRFCATGRQGWLRNLETFEIIGQFLVAQRRLQALQRAERCRITNVVFMGMGEPLLNTANVLPALHLLLDDFGAGLAKRRVTVSTSGVIPGMEALSESIDVALALSLHAPDNELRDRLMPINRRYPLSRLIPALQRYIERSKANQGYATIEYLLLAGVNDEPHHADALAKLLRSLPSKINLIPWNPNPYVAFVTPSFERIERFRTRLQSHGFLTLLRKTRGEDIRAACGQLVGYVPSQPQQPKESTLNGAAFKKE